MIGDSWSEQVSRALLEQAPWVGVLFVFFILIHSFLLLNIIVAVLLDKVPTFSWIRGVRHNIFLHQMAYMDNYDDCESDLSTLDTDSTTVRAVDCVGDTPQAASSDGSPRTPHTKCYMILQADNPNHHALFDQTYIQPGAPTCVACLNFVQVSTTCTRVSTL